MNTSSQLSDVFNLENIKEARSAFLSRYKFKLMMLNRLPLGFFIGMRVTEMDDEHCKVTVPHKWLNKNPFKSTFWAVLGMAAEMTSGAMLLAFTNKMKPSIATILVGNTAEFYKKATKITTFECLEGLRIAKAVELAIQTKEAQAVTVEVLGKNPEGDLVARFTFTWSMKMRSK